MIHVFFNIKDQKFEKVKKQIKLEKTNSLKDVFDYVSDTTSVPKDEICLLNENDEKFMIKNQGKKLEDCKKKGSTVIKFDVISLKSKDFKDLKKTEEKKEIKEEIEEKKEKLSPNSTFIPSEYKCPISKEILFDAITLEDCSHSFSLEFFKKYAEMEKKNGKNIECPVCKTSVQSWKYLSPEFKKEIYQYVQENLEESFAKDFKKKYLIYQKDLALQKAFTLNCKDVGFHDTISSKNYPQFDSEPIIWFYKKEDTIFILPIDTTIQLNNYINTMDSETKYIRLNIQFILDVKSLKLFNEKEKSISEVIPFKCSKDSSKFIDKSVNPTLTNFIACAIEAGLSYNFTKMYLSVFDRNVELNLKNVNIKNFSLKDLIIDKFPHQLFDKETTSKSFKFGKSSYESKPGFYKWQFKTNKGWSDLDKEDSIFFEKNFQNNIFTFKMQMRGVTYDIDLKKLLQTNVMTGTERGLNRSFVKY